MDEKVKELYGIIKQSKDFSSMFNSEDELKSMVSTPEGLSDRQNRSKRP